jgi:hypothetical protein
MKIQKVFTKLKVVKINNRGSSFFLYFLFGQFMTGQRAQFSSSSFSMPKGIISPHWQTQPSDFFVSSCSSQNGQASIVLSLL